MDNKSLNKNGLGSVLISFLVVVIKFYDKSNWRRNGFILTGGLMVQVEFIMAQIQIMENLKQLIHGINFIETERDEHMVFSSLSQLL